MAQKKPAPKKKSKPRSSLPPVFPGYPEVEYHVDPKLPEMKVGGGRIRGVFLSDEGTAKVGGYKGSGPYPKVLVASENDPQLLAHEFAHYEQMRQADDLGDWHRRNVAGQGRHRTASPEEVLTAIRAARMQGFQLPQIMTAEQGRVDPLIQWFLNPIEQQADRGGDYYAQYIKQTSDPSRRRLVHLPMRQILDAWKVGEGMQGYYANVARQDRAKRGR